MSGKDVAADVQRLPVDGDRGSASPGAQLRAAREAQKLTAQDMAARLNLDLRVITTLEADRFDELRVPAYVRGYLRSYARQVGLDGDALVRSFDAQSAAPAPPLHPFRSRPPAQTDTSNHGVRLASAVVVVLVLGLAFSWWRARDVAPGEAPIVAELPPDTPLPPPMGEAESGGSTYRYPIVDHGAAPSTAAPPGPPPLPAYEPEAAGAAVAAGPSAYTPPADDPEAALSMAAAAAAPPAGAAAGNGDTLATREDGGSGEAAPAAEPASAAATEAGGNVSLAIGLSGQAWVEVHDANDRRLYFNMGAAGQTIAARGEGPLRVVIGNIRAARLSVGGRDIPLEPLAHEGVARLRVTAGGAEPLRRPGG